MFGLLRALNLLGVLVAVTSTACNHQQHWDKNFLRCWRHMNANIGTFSITATRTNG